MKRFFILVMCLCMAVPINVCAANQKIKVNPVYQNNKVIKGKTKKRYRIQAKIGKKKYQTKADRKGNFRLRIPKQSVGKSFYIKVYRGKRYISKKKIYVLTKSIKVQKFSTKNKMIKGYARPGYRIKVTMNHKSYQTKASRVKGSFKVQMKRPAGNATAKISLYNKKGKYIKSVKYSAYNKKSNKKDQNTKKAQYTTADGKKYTGRVPGFDDPINLLAVEKQMNEARMEYDDSKTIIETSSGRAFMNATSGHGQGYYGWISYYMETESDNQWQWYHAKNGITLYYITATTGDLRNTPTPDCNDPTTYEGKIKSGQTGKFAPTYKSSRDLSYLGIKIVGYKNQKPVIYYAVSEQLMAGTIGIAPQIQ